MLIIQEYDLFNHIWFCLLVVGSLLSMTTYTWQFRSLPGGTPQICIQLCKSMWLVLLVLISMGLYNNFFLSQLLHIVDMLCPYFWLIFVLEISRQQEKIPRRIRFILSTVVYCVAIGRLIQALYILFFPGSWLKKTVLPFVLLDSIGISGLLSYLLCVSALGFSIRWIWITAGLRHQQALWFTVAGIISTAGAIFIVFFPVYGHIVLSCSFFISGIFITWGFYRWHVYNVLPLSQKIVVRNMIDGLLVVDEYGYIADFNTAAQSIFQEAPCHIGDSFDSVITIWPELAAVYHADTIQLIETARDYSEERRYYQLQIIPLKTQGKWLGAAIVFKNITEQKKQQRKLLEQQHVVSILTERERLRRELHDDQAQVYSFLGFELQTIYFFLCDGQKEKAVAEVEKLREIVKNRSFDTRESIMGLKRTSAADSDFITKIRNYLAWYENNSGIMTRLVLPVQPVNGLLSDIAKLQILRVVQEALTNIRKHAKAQTVTMTVVKTEEEFIVTIEDDGCGFDSAAAYGKGNHFGLQIMAERAAEAGGRLSVHTVLGNGTTVKIRFSLKEKKETVKYSENSIS